MPTATATATVAFPVSAMRVASELATKLSVGVDTALPMTVPDVDAPLFAVRSSAPTQTGAVLALVPRADGSLGWANATGAGKRH